MKSALFFTFFLFYVVSQAQIQVDNFIKKHEKDHAIGVNRAMRYMDSIGHGSLVFNGAKNYHFYSTVELPRYQTKGRRLFVFEGNGCHIQCYTDTLDVFRRLPTSQKEALNKMMASRFTFKDFSIRGGAKGINLGASYGSSILRCNFWGQHQAAIDIQFGLNTLIHHCNSTAAKRDNFILRSGEDWGGNQRNSQSNHSVISMCRVYAAKGSNTAFKILGSNGVVLRDIISEGQHEMNYSIYFHSQGSPNVKYFKLENLHLEHAPNKAGLYLNGGGSIDINGIYYQHAHDQYRLIHAGQFVQTIHLQHIPWFVSRSGIYYENPSTRWKVSNCHKTFSSKGIWFYKKGKDNWIRKAPKRNKK